MAGELRARSSLLGLKRTDARGQKAALEYFFLSLIASAVFLHGAASLYGIAGTTSLAGIAAPLQSADGMVSGMAVVGTAVQPIQIPIREHGDAGKTAANYDDPAARRLRGESIARRHRDRQTVAAVAWASLSSSPWQPHPPPSAS